MRILLDECVHAGVRAAFPGHSVKTVTEAGWRSSKDGPILADAEQHFDVFVTIDRRIEHDHNLAAYRIGFVLARVRNSTLESYKPIFSELLKATVNIAPGEIRRAGTGG